MRKETLFVRQFIWIIIVAYVAVSQVEASRATESHTTSASATGAQIVENLIKVIENPIKRELFLDSLKQIVAGNEQAFALDKKNKSDDFKSENSNSRDFGGNLMRVVGMQTEQFFGALTQTIKNLNSIGDVPQWIIYQISTKEKQEYWLELIFAGILFPIFIALSAKWLINLAFKRTIQRLRAAASETIRDRMMTGLLRGVLEATSVGVILIAGYLVLNLVPRSTQSAELAELFINGIALVTGIGVVARIVLAPQAELLRPIPLASRTTAYLYVWIMRIATVGVLGFIISKMVTHPQNFDQRLAVDIVFAAIISGMVSIVILQSKEQFSSFIRGLGVGGIRNRLADIWHVLALIYVFVVFCVFSSGAQNGFIYLTTATMITICAALGGLLLSFLFGRAIERIFRIEPSINEKFPGLKDRSNLYRPVMRRIVDVLSLIHI